MTDAGEPTPNDEVEQDARAATDVPADHATDATDPLADAADPLAALADDAHEGELEPVEDPRSREELLVELAAAEARRDEFLDDLRRARAEFENFRKRTTREAAQQRELGKGDAVTALLEVLDDLDRTVEAANQSADDNVAKGVTLVADKLVRTLQGLGLERVDDTGVHFDPNHHEAVSQQPADEPGDHPVVAQVFRPGYRLGERILRPAMVVVEQ